MRSKERKSLLRNLTNYIKLAYPSVKLIQGQDHFHTYFGLPKEELIRHFESQAKRLGYKINDYGLTWSVRYANFAYLPNDPESFLSLENVRAVPSSEVVRLSQEERSRAEYRVLRAVIGKGMREAKLALRYKTSQSRAIATDNSTICAINLRYCRETQHIMRGIMHSAQVKKSRWGVIDYYTGLYIRD